jgi:hypothetical protein
LILIEVVGACGIENERGTGNALEGGFEEGIVVGVASAGLGAEGSDDAGEGL